MPEAVILGIEELMLKLIAMPVVVEAGAKGGREAAAMSVMELARQEAPVDTGALVESIGIAEEGEVIGAGVPYSIFVEQGTSFMAPEPFLGPAFDQQQETVMKAISDAVRLATLRLASG